jgi:hypothetical protein
MTQQAKIESLLSPTGDKLKNVRLKLVKSKSIEFLDQCEGCLFHNKEEKMDCSLIGSPMSCVVDMHYFYVWKHVPEQGEV